MLSDSTNVQGVCRVCQTRVGESVTLASTRRPKRIANARYSLNALSIFGGMVGPQEEPCVPGGGATRIWLSQNGFPYGSCCFAQ